MAVTVALYIGVMLAAAISPVVSAVDSVASSMDNQNDISIHADYLKVATGEDVDFLCTTLTKQHVIWFHPNGSDINSLNSSRMEYNTTSGELSVLDADLTDAGNYTCQTEDGLLEASVELEVYIMPDYFLEGMIILAINACLAIIFAGCTVFACVREHQLKKKAKKAGFMKSSVGQEVSYTAGIKGAM